MKKYKIIPIILITLYSLLSKAQGGGEEIVLRHIKGVQSVEGNYGFTQLGNSFELNYAKFVSDKVFILTGGNYEKGVIGRVNFTDYSAHFGTALSLFKIGSRLYFNIPLAAYIGIETINPYTSPNHEFSYAGDNIFIYGLSGGINPEFFINKTTSIIIHAKEYFIMNCPMGSWKYQVMGGLRFIIN